MATSVVRRVALWMTLPDGRGLLMALGLILVVTIGGDALVFSWPDWAPRLYWALLDPLVHGLLALCVVLPLLLRLGDRARIVGWGTVAVAAALLIDLDHAVAAGSLNLRDMLTLETRPAGHSLLFVAAGSALAWAATRHRAGWLGALVVFGALFSHVARDASHGSVPLFWPLTMDITIAVPLYVMIELLTACALFAISRNLPRNFGAPPSR